MTEAEWLAATDPVPMIYLLGKIKGFRKITLYCCACCRTDWDQLATETRDAVELAEQHAGTNRGVDVRVKFARQYNARAAFRTIPASPMEAITNALTISVQTMHCPSGDVQARQHADAGRVELIREIAGNPFRPVAVDPAWHTSTVMALARQMYESRDFSPMPILADALQDAGCDHPDLLDHCRGPGTHVRGCWAVDLLLGKE